MAGLLLHLAMGDPERLNPDNPAYSASEKAAYAIGLLLPDIAKQEMIQNAGDFGRLFEGCSEPDILTYDEYLQFCKTHHFNPDSRNPAQQDTKNPDLEECLNTGYVDMNKPVWKGVFCHLMGDKAFYYKAYCVDDVRAMDDYRQEAGDMQIWDRKKWKNSETGRVYYEDYDVLNQCVENEFGVLYKLSRILSAGLLHELLSEFMVGFSAGRTEPVYMNLENIRKYIAHSHCLCTDIEEGKTEKVLRFFDENKLDGVFCGRPEYAD